MAGREVYHANAIEWHGEPPKGLYTAIPNEIVDDTSVGPAAYMIGIRLRRHMDGWETSQKRIADTLGMGRNRVAMAFNELQAARWLIVREYRSSAGGLITSRYLMHHERLWTSDEIALLSVPVVLAESQSEGACSKTERAPKRSRQGAPQQSRQGAPKQSREPAPKQSTKQTYAQTDEINLVVQPRYGGEPPDDGNENCHEDDQPREATALSADWWPSAFDFQAMIRETGRDRGFIEYQTGKFIDDYRSTNAARGRQVDWRETWRRWILKADREVPRQAAWGMS